MSTDKQAPLPPSREAIDAALRAKQEPAQALPPVEGSAGDTTGLQVGKP